MKFQLLEDCLAAIGAATVLVALTGAVVCACIAVGQRRRERAAAARYVDRRPS